MSELHSRNLIQFEPGEGDHFRSLYVFRGMDDAKWSLATSLERLSRKPDTDTILIEKSLIRSFRKYASAGTFDQKSEWYVLAVAQHNGLPTRCLDWTASPLVAAHFACGCEGYKNDDGAIWCLHLPILREINEGNVPHEASLRGVAWVYDTHLLERGFTDLDALDNNAGLGELMLLWEPPSLDARIANQYGLLSIMNSPTKSQNAFLETHSNDHPGLVLRIVVDAKAKSEIRDMLDQNAISERTLFPGLPGLCDWLRRRYGRAW